MFYVLSICPLLFFFFFFFNDTATTEIYTLSLHDALPISQGGEDEQRIHIVRVLSEAETNEPGRVGPFERRQLGPPQTPRGRQEPCGSGAVRGISAGLG